MRSRFVTLLTFALAGFSFGCGHECSCTPKGTWNGATTISSTGYSSTTSYCSSAADITDPKERRTQCSYVCTERLRSQGLTSDYDNSASPTADACVADCKATAKLSTECVEGKRVSTFMAWN